MMKAMTRFIFAPLMALTLASVAHASGEVLSAPEALAAAEAGQLTIVDIRTPPEWRQTGIAKGVALIDMQHPGGAQGFMDALLQKVGGDKSAPIALICRTGNRTTMVQRYLESQGFTRVFNIKEGMAGSAAGPGWLRRGLPVESCERC